MTRRSPLALVVAVSLGVAVSCSEAKPPNILWITVEDMSPNLGAWGDPYARTPNIDRLASEGPDDLEAALSVLQKELAGDDLDAALLACRTLELLGERARPAARSMRSAAARFEDAEGDQALFIRFSTSAFLSRLGR